MDGTQLTDPSTRTLPLTPGQRGIWTAELLGAAAAADRPSPFVIGRVLRVAAELRPEALEEALRHLVRRHDALRSAVVDTADGPVLRAAPTPRDDLVEVWDALSDDRLRAFHGRPFDLSRPPALRVAVVPDGPGQTLLVLCAHHLVCDGPGMATLVAELGVAYTACRHGETPTFDRPAVAFHTFRTTLDQHLASPKRHQALDHWRRLLDPAPPVALPPTDLPRPPVATHRGGAVPFRVDLATTRKLEELARATRVTPFAVLLAAVQTLVALSGGVRDVTVGMTVSGRAPVPRGPLVGMTANLAAVRTAVAPEAPFTDVVRRTATGVVGAVSHGWLPFETVLEELRPPRDASTHPVFQTLLTYDDERHTRAPAFDGAPAEPLPRPAVWAGAARMDLTLALTRDAAGLRGQLEYNADVYLPDTARRLTGWLGTLLRQVADRPDTPVRELTLLDDAERAAVLAAAAGPRLPVPEVCLHQLVTRQAAATPHAPAVIGGGGRLSYRQLDERSDALAQALLARGVGPETRVGIHLERTPDLVVSVLAVLKAGGAYVPLDPDYPATRLAHMIADSGAVAVLTRTPLPEEVGDVPAVSPDARPEGPARPLPRVRPDNLAYVIYTSGSSGTPKGVAIEHRNAVNLVTWARDHFPAEALEAVLAATSLCFDLSVFELFVPLAGGGLVVLARNALELVDGSAAPVSLVNTVPSALAELLRADALPDTASFVNLAGEPLPRDLAAALADRGTAVLRNLYGPSETTTYSTVAVVDPRGRGPVSIGRPVANTTVYVLDELLRPVPDGVVGELVIGGAGVARGYHDRPDLTRERFVPDPYADEPGARMYRTGDRARRRPDGSLEYLGREDGQVKLRGFRIELGEVEAVLRGLPGVRAACAAVRRLRGEPTLVGYVVGEDGEDPDVGRLQAAAAETLPAYMVPAHWTVLPKLPLLPNGKTDRSALPDPTDEPTPDASPGAASPDGAAPRAPAGPSDPTDPTAVVEAVWRDLLGRRSIRHDVSFFEQGGTSLLLVRMHALLAEHGHHVPIARLLRHTTVPSLAAYLKENA